MTREKVIEYTIGYKPEVFHYDEVVFESLNDDVSIRINYLGMERDFYVFMKEWFPLDWKDDEEEDTYEPFTTRQLMQMFEQFDEINICTECYGEGFYEVFQGCSRPASDCCGGCTRKEVCNCLESDKLFQP
jgi:hypothetical protein